MSIGYQTLVLFGMFIISLLTTSAQNNGSCTSTSDQRKWIIPLWQGYSLLIGEWVKIDCRLNSNESNATLWQTKKWGQKKLSQRIPDGKYIQVAEKNMFLLSGIKKSDKGSYYCKADCAMQKLAVKLYIEVNGKAFAKPNVTKIPNELITPYYSAITLVCEVYGPYVVTWYKVGFGELWGKESTVNEIVKSEIRIPNVTKKDDGIYVCEIKRFIVKYIANDTVVVKSQEPKAPSFSGFYVSSEIIMKEYDSLAIKYSVHGIPQPVTVWLRSKNELPAEKIIACSSKSGHCILSRWREETISKNSFRFTVLKVEYPTEDNVTYSFSATNNFGKASKSFTIRVHTKPKLEVVKKQKLIFQKEMKLNCSVKKVNPKKIHFTWQYCEPEQSKCDPSNDDFWTTIYIITKEDENLTSSIVLNDLPKKRMFRCKADNYLGTDHISYEVIKMQESFDDNVKDSSSNLLSTIIPVGIFLLLVVTVVSFVMCKRIKLYGGLYIFSYPPIHDYIDQLDYNKNIREQIQKLPYVPEWEFPREKVSLHSELGKGEFASVWLAHASGIKEFHPRDIIKERHNRTRLSVLIRALRSRNNSYVSGEEVTTVAVKKLKDDFDKEKLIDLQSELKILIHAGEHENIVNLLGACTKGTSYDLWVILEYCSNGDLRSFLRQGRNRYEEDETSLAVNMSVRFGPRNLIHIAFQIAKGMEFLVSRKVHACMHIL